MRNVHPEQYSSNPLKHSEVLALVLSGLMDWENQHEHAFHSLSARELYFRLALIHFSHPQSQKISLKQAFYTGRASERTMRNAIRRFEDQGFIKKTYSRRDYRTTRLFPEEKLIKLFEAHTQEFVRLIQLHFYLIRKENSQDMRDSDFGC